MKEKLLNFINKVRPKSITSRWIINIILLIFILLTVFFIVASFWVKTFYYDSVENIIDSGASSSAVNYFEANLDSGTSLQSIATDFIDSYTYKDKTTLWVIDSNGEVIASSDGFIDVDVSMPDYEDSVSNDSGIGEYTGEIYEGGENIMAVCHVITDSDGTEVGAVRVMTSIEQINSQITTLILLIFVAVVVIFLIIIFSNLFFIRSIVNPIKHVTETTKTIAQGNLDVRIEKKYNDEIGDLCDSINSMASEIASSDKMKNDFISTISHELRTPLTSIKGWAETISFGLNEESDELTVKGMKVITSEAERLGMFVEELLDFSRLQSGRMNLRLTKTDIFAELDETVLIFRERAMREGIELRYSIPSLPAPANADPNRLKQVFTNVLDNALKYSRPESRIYMKAEYSKLDGKDAAKISVADQGCGISKEDLPHVTEKFYKANASVRGSGIGLAVTNEIVNLHGGKFEIDSEEGKGTLVTIYLPIESAPSKKEIDMSSPGGDEVTDEDITLKGN